MAEVVCDVKQPHEVDSAAEFLAQQQNEIAGTLVLLVHRCRIYQL